MKILYLNTTGSLGGAEMCLVDVLAALRGAPPGWGLELIVGEDGPLAAEARALGVPVAVLPLPGSAARLGDSGAKGRAGKLALALGAARASGPMAAYLGRLGKAIRASGADVLHTNGMKAHLLGSWASPSGMPLLWHLHDYLGSRAVMGRLLRMAARPGRTLGVGVSRSVADDARGVLRGRAEVTFAYNAADLRRFSPEGPRVDLDAACGLPPAAEGTVRVGLIATFALWKGQGTFLEAVAAIPGDLRRRARFVIVGGPIYKTGGSQWTIEALKAKAEALGLAGEVGFAGFQPDPAAAIRGLDVVVHASTQPEPFGRVIVEGMACGRAVVAVETGGSGELFTPGEDALGVPAGDPGALAKALSDLIADADLRSRLGAAGRLSAEGRFDRDALAPTWEAIYAEASAVGRPAGRT